MEYKIALLPGDGIGPEVAKQAVNVLESVGKAFGHTFTFEEGLVGAIAIDKIGNPLPDETIKICLRGDAVLFGAIGDPKYDTNPDAKVRPEQGLLKLRKSLGLYTNVRPVKAYPTLLDKSPLKRNRIEGADMLIYRELTGGIYFGEKHLSEDGKQASDLCSYSEEEISRIARMAFEAAQLRRKKVTLVDKANVLETSRLWRRVVTKIAKEEYPQIELDFLFVDNAAMQMILDPRQFDVILTENMFGDIISDEASVIGGSIGLLASASIGDEHGLFEPIHGSYPQAKGKNIANPIASILSAALLLDYLGLNEEGNAVREAVDIALANGVVTSDLDEHSTYGTKAVGDYISVLIQSAEELVVNLNHQNISLGQSTII
ncbi:3-isopropylmalate dehydrogenase [Owenweeksia hongkongensis]|uniref:3-isopropylmalate dehydrogenase n=1 Tax=Owenweeksia hongkongensis TaxID=253245 RepID=UPI003A939F08